MDCIMCGSFAGYLTPRDTFPLCSQSCADDLMFEVIVVTNGG